GEIENLLADQHRRGVTRAPGDDRAAAGERACPPMEFASVAGDDPDVFDVYTKGIRNKLSEHSEVSLPLRPDARCASHLAARLDRHARALVWTNAGAFDITRDADAG